MTQAATANKQPASAGTLGEGTLLAQRTSFNTLDNWGHKTPTQSKRKRTGQKILKGHGPEHTQYTELHLLAVSVKHCSALGFFVD